jgi:hypothetical protein
MTWRCRECAARFSVLYARVNGGAVPLVTGNNLLAFFEADGVRIAYRFDNAAPVPFASPQQVLWQGFFDDHFPL